MSDTQHPTPDTRAAAERSEDSYVIDAGLKMLRVLECLEGRSFEPVNIKRVAERSGFNRSFCRSALITLKKAQFAKQVLSSSESLWTVGPKIENLARAYSAELLKSQPLDPRSADQNGVKNRT